MRRLFAVLVLAVPLAGLMAAPALAGGGGHGICAGFTESDTVEMLDSCFQAVATVVEPGSVTVHNGGYVTHNLTAVDGSFTTGSVAPGEDATVDITTPGVHRIYCTLHGTADGDGMSGLLIVGDPAGLVPAEAAAESGPPTLPWVATGVSSAAALALLVRGRGLRERVPVTG